MTICKHCGTEIVKLGNFWLSSHPANPRYCPERAAKYGGSHNVHEPKEEPIKVGAECPMCAWSEHTGIWDGESFHVCPVCNDRGVLDEAGVKILRGLRK
jgi:adenine-specific DNA methylase